MKQRENPILTASCPDCGAIFFGCVMDNDTFVTPEEGEDPEENTGLSIVKYAREGYNISVVSRPEFKFGKCICNQPEVKITEGMVLIATDECRMNASKSPALQIGGEYPVLTVDGTKSEFSVLSDFFQHHFFSTDKNNAAYWKLFFTVK